MFPYPSGSGLHVGHPLGYIGTDIYARFKRMMGFNVLHTMGYDAFGLPAERYAVETGEHPEVSTANNITNMRRQLHRLGLGHDPRRSIATTDVEYYRWTQWIFLQIFNSWYDESAERARPIEELVEEFESGKRNPPREQGLGRPVEGRARPARRLVPARLPRRRDGELVPRARHGARQRGGDRGRPQRDRRSPRLQAPAAPVDDAHHRLCRPPDRRPRPRRVARVAEGDAAQLDRPQRGRAAHVRQWRGQARRVHDPARHPVRRDVRGRRAGAPTARRRHPGRVAGGHAGEVARPATPMRAPPRRWPPTEPPPSAPASASARWTPSARASTRASTRPIRSRARPSRSSPRTTC